jgi:hypothetical protein
MDEYDDISYATDAELYDPANQGFYGDYGTATLEELAGPENQGFYGSAAQPPADAAWYTKLLQNAKSGIANKLSTPAGIGDLLLAGLQAYGALNPKFARARGTEYQGVIPMNMKAIRTEYAQAPRAYGEGARGQKYSDVTYAAEGGIMGLARGGRAKRPRYLEGATDGMADKINTTIDDRQAAKLSHGEFVIPADVVSHLGNGNSKAGANELYKMMDRVRQARTGTKKQGKQINPDEFTPGKSARKGVKSRKAKPAFADGGSVSQTSGLAPYAGDYITQTLGKANALSNAPLPTYTGQLTAGTSPLQQTAFDAAGKLTGSLNDFGTVQSYMNPYISDVLNRQSDEARRQSAITQTGINAQATQQGAFGGSRSALMSAENNRNLGSTLADIQAVGLNRAYDNAQRQQAEAGRYGLDSLNTRLKLGTSQRDIEQEALTAQKNQWDKQAQAPFDLLNWRMKLLGNLPVGADTTTQNTSPMQDWANTVGGIGSLFK